MIVKASFKFHQSKAHFKFNRLRNLKFMRRDSLNLARHNYPRSMSRASSKSKFKRTLRSSKIKFARLHSECKIPRLSAPCPPRYDFSRTALPPDALSQTFIKLYDTVLPAICAAARTKTRATIARGRRKSKLNFARVKSRRTEPP